MIFTSPIGLLGLFSLPLIFALHMLRERSQRRVVSSLSLWNFLDVQVRGARARQIPLSWLLLIDLLIAALLSLALAGPQLSLDQTARQASHAIFLLDISTSMGAEDGIPTRFSAARSELEGMILELGPQDLATVLTFGSAASVLGDSRSMDLLTLVERVQGLVPGGSGADIRAGLALAQAALSPDIPAAVHIFTDAAFLEPELDGMPFPLEWHIFGRTGENQAVLGISAARLSEQKFQVFARFANFGSEPAVRPGALYADGALVTSFEVALEPGTTLPKTWDVVGNPTNVQVVLGEGDGLPADDLASLGLNPREIIKVALVTEEPGPVRRALEAIPNVDLQVIPPVDYLPGSPFDLVVFRGFLPDRWPGGAVLVLDPPASSSLLGTVSRIQIGTPPIPSPDPLLLEVDFTGVRWSEAWRIGSLPSGFDRILETESSPLILRGRVGISEILLLLPVIADANGTPTPFARHPAFPVLIANAAAGLGETTFPDQLPVGDPLGLPPVDRYPEVEVLTPDGKIVVDFPLGRVFDETQVPGLYRLATINFDGVRRQSTLGVNAGEISELNIAPNQFQPPEQPTADGSSNLEQPVALAAWLLGAAAVLLFLQAWIAWR